MKLPRRSRFIVAILAGVLPGCDTAPKNSSARATPPPVTATTTPVAQDREAAPPSEAESAGPEAAASSVPRAVPPPLMPLNVPECDNFVKMYVACLDDHGPPDRREALMDELHLHRARWRELEKMQEGKVAAGLSCRGVAQRLKGDLIVDYGCEF